MAPRILEQKDKWNLEWEMNFRLLKVYYRKDEIYMESWFRVLPLN